MSKMTKRMRIVQPQQHTFDAALLTRHVELDEVGIAAEEGPHDARPLVLDPTGRAGEWRIETAELRAPPPDIEVEVPLTVAHVALRRHLRRRGRRGRRDEGQNAETDHRDREHGLTEHEHRFLENGERCTLAHATGPQKRRFETFLHSQSGVARRAASRPPGRRSPLTFCVTHPNCYST